jgi:cell fate regulator YaaT (PSP1 superfamily)
VTRSSTPSRSSAASAHLYYLSEERVDLRDLVRELQPDFNRVELRQVGARDEARLTADYEKCGQYCCCKNFLKVLKPVSMKSAKTQKATLDPLKISGRCGRLMCCLRYEDETYDELKRLPNRKKPRRHARRRRHRDRRQILTQLVLVEARRARSPRSTPSRARATRSELARSELA